MSVELLESIKRQAEALTPQEKSRLGAYLLEQATLDSEIQAAPVDEKTAGLMREQRLLRNLHMEWLRANNEQFGGQYVALDGDQLVSTGRTFRAATEAARAVGKAGAFVTYLPKPDELIEGGGWL